MLVTSLPASVSALKVWLDYNGRAGIENVIKELRGGLGLSVLFARHLGWLERGTIATLHFHLFGCAGIISNSQGQITLKLGIPLDKQHWWFQIWQKILSPFPNCNAVA